jgi:hypothetical protein
MRVHARQVNESDAVAYRHHFRGDVPPVVNDVLRSAGHPLDPSTRVLMEDRFGHDFSKVRVHSDPLAANSASAVNAQAYTVGSQIVFGAGRYNSTAGGQHLLAHELTHVVQQGGAAGTSLQRAPIEEDEIHKPMIEQYRKDAGLPPGGVDEFGQRVGPSDAEIKYGFFPSMAAASVPYCPSVAVLEGNLDFSSEKTRKAYTDANCLTSASQSMAPVCQFKPAQEKALADAQKIAKGRVDRALGFIGMGKEGKKMAREMAGELFLNDPPTLKEVVERLTKVRDFLKTAKIDFAGRTCGDAECQRGVVAYVTGPGALPIHICPTAFSMPSSLHQTVLHESLHWTGLDADPTTPEGYCSKFDCKTPCHDKEVADAWSHYIDCLGKPFTIRKDFTDKMEESLRDLP